MNRGSNLSLLLLCYCAGVITVQLLPTLPPLWPALLIPPLLLARRHLPAQLLIALLAGFCWAVFISSSVWSKTIPLELEKQDVTLTGQVVDVPYPGERFIRFDFRVESLRQGEQEFVSPGTIRLRWYEPAVEVRSGQRWRLVARLKRARGFQNPGGFDYETWLFQNRIRATGYIRNPDTAEQLAGAGWGSRFDAFREQTAAFVRDSLPESEFSGLVTALAVGVRSSMNGDQWQVLQRTGTIHLVAISGLHIGLVSGLVFALAALLWRLPGKTVLRLPAPRFAMLASLLAGIGYAGLAGFSIPTRRAALMLATATAALFFQRRPGSLEVLLLVLAVVLTLDPLAPLAIGFWLSFAAVAVIVLAVTSFSRPRRPPLQETHSATTLGSLGERILHGLRQWGVIQLALLIGLAPLLLIFFQRLSLAAPLANLIAIPVVGMAVVPLALIGVLLFALGIESPATLAFHGAERLLDWLWPLLEGLSNMTWSVWEQPMPPTWAILLGAAGALILLAPRGLPGRWTGLIWMLPMFWARPVLPGAGEMSLTVLEVGQGLSAVLQTRGHTLVYDAGPSFGQGFDAGEAVVTPFLRHQGIRRIDTLVISHGDNDHIGGMQALLDNLPVGRRLTSAPEQVPGGEQCASGQQWEWDGVAFEVLWPAPDTRMRGNKASCVIKAVSAHGSVLLTGDIERAAEYRMLRREAPLDVDLLLVPHHGSKTSSQPRFLDAVSPRLAVVSSGYRNRFNHPNPTVMRRYRERDITVQDTARAGALRYRFTENGLEVEGYRQTKGKYWLINSAAKASP
ncbi:MAG: DNA internalization-related competence protein ComEC/Rec2 [Pseudomonadota bacterium]|nr:DNA internalization-related competence protein ComEC/Rec2 [Pseudomonadota bacterium]